MSKVLLKSRIMANKELSYQDAMSELESILGGIQSQQTDIDQLAENIKRAAELIKFCKTKLKTAEEQIQGIFEE